MTRKNTSRQLAAALANPEINDDEIIALGDYPEVPLPGIDPDRCTCDKGDRYLSVELTDAEVAALAGEAALKRKRAAELEEEKARVAKSYKAKIDGLAVKAEEDEAKVISRSEDRRVPVITVNDTAHNERITYRLDGGVPKEVERRTLSLDELATVRDEISSRRPAPATEPDAGEVPLDVPALLEQADEVVRVAWDGIRRGDLENQGRAPLKALITWAKGLDLDPGEHGPIREAMGELSRRSQARRKGEEAV